MSLSPSPPPSIYIYRDGTESPQGNSTKAFAKLLVNRAVEVGIVQDTKVPFIYLWDERLTSQAAKVNIKTKAFLFSCKSCI